MSTPRRHEKWCKSMPREFDAMMGRGPYECDCGPEGVAAPLEPTAEEFWQKVNCFPKDILPKLSLFDCQKLDEIIVEAMEAYAAAVSKNLQEELAEIRRQRDSAQSNVAEWKDLVKLQRKEITALRETK